jgi:hypothetical protein
LFAAVEAPQGQEAKKTGKTLEEMTWIMLGQDQIDKGMIFGNAGNDAYVSLDCRIHALRKLMPNSTTWKRSSTVRLSLILCVTIPISGRLTSVVTGPPLDVLRTDYHQSQLRSQKDQTSAEVAEEQTGDDIEGNEASVRVGAPTTDQQNSNLKAKGIQGDHAMPNVTNTKHDLPVDAGQMATPTHESDSDNDDDMIQGVYFEDQQGNVMQYDVDEDDD